MATAKTAFKFAYPDKTPVYKAKAYKIEAPIHTEQLTNAYKTTRDVALELRKELEPFLVKAKERVCELIRETNKLKKDLRVVKKELEQAREELKLAKEALVVANSKTLYPALMLLEGDPADWCKGEVDNDPY